MGERDLLGFGWLLFRSLSFFLLWLMADYYKDGFRVC